MQFSRRGRRGCIWKRRHLQEIKARLTEPFYICCEKGYGLNLLWQETGETLFIKYIQWRKLHISTALINICSIWSIFFPFSLGFQMVVRQNNGRKGSIWLNCGYSMVLQCASLAWSRLKAVGQTPRHVPRWVQNWEMKLINLGPASGCPHTQQCWARCIN